MYDVYVTRMVPEANLERLRQLFDVEINAMDRPLTREELLAKVAGRDGIISFLTDRIDGDKRSRRACIDRTCHDPALGARGR